ncbi:MAG: HXXEE domain-containing protein [Bacteroidia bacterium]
MNFLRKHWYDLGGFLSIIVLMYVAFNFHYLTKYQLIMWLSLASLFFHQLEEYRIVGTFPGMLNTAMYKSATPNHYPLNTNTSLCINVTVGWLCYFLAAIFAEKAIWLGIATILISAGNIIAHTFLFNIKGKTFYNAGLATCWLFFAPCVYFFFSIGCNEHLITKTDYLIGIPLGIILNVVGVLKLIDWLADKNSSYIFDDRNLLPKDRK